MEEKISGLLDWATAHGAVLHPSVEIYNDPVTGLSFRVRQDATTSLPPWEPIVHLPTKLSFSYLNALPDSPNFDSSQSLPQELIAQTPPHVIGRLLLAKHCLLGTTSFWHPYIASLPPPSDVEAWALPPFWDREEQELLEGTNVEVGLDKIKGDVEREWGAARELLKLYGGEIDKRIGKREYEWAYCVFSSRSFRPSLVLSEEEAAGLPTGVGIDDFSVLLPVFDVGNHDMTAEVKWELSTEGPEASCELRVGKEHKPGQQVFNNYSMKTNAELLLGYGFMIPPTEELHNDYTHVRKRTSDPKASEEYYISRRPMAHPSSLLGRYKTTLHIDIPPGKSLFPPFSHIQSDMIWDIFLTLTTPDERATILPSTSPASQQTRFFTADFEQGSPAWEKLEHTLGVVQNKIWQELERLLETDVEVGGDEIADLSDKQRLALEYRARCRSVLEEALVSMGAVMDEGGEENGVENGA